MPVIWLLDAYRAGERGQVRALADALGWPCEIKALSYRSLVFWPHLFHQASLAGVTATARELLRPPWPDLVISSGVRNEPVCRWIRQQSGGKTRYVHIGRPWAPPELFDLVISTPQYRVPQHPRVLNNLLTLHSVTPETLATARAKWQERFRDLPGPYFGVLTGGDSGPFTLGPKAAARLGRDASVLARAHGGSLLISTSSRTSAAASAALADAVSVPHYLYRWRPADGDNPYLGILAVADRLIVTADSIAMLSEACATGKPVSMFDLGGMRRGMEVEQRDFRLGGWLYQFMMDFLWQPLSRDITRVHAQLRAAGRATWMDDMMSVARVPRETDLQRAVEAVRALFGET
ncbi:MAG: ELM1/GtrOC1 family putative glycosyltransferase [Pseudomonadota bacterium]